MEKVAVIDMGSNSARLVLAYVLPDGFFVVFDELKETVRLGEDMERDGFLKPSRVAQAVKTLKMFRKLCDANGVTKIYAVATNAVRSAKNQKGFLEEVSSVCGFKFKVLSADDEAAYIYHGVTNSLDTPKGVIMDISGSSIQLIYYNRRSIIHFENLPFGAMSLSGLYADPSLKPEEQAQNIREFIYDQAKRIPWLKELDSDTEFVGVGGAFRNLAKIAQRLERYPLSMVHNYNVSAKQINEIYDMVKVLEPDKRMKIKGLSSARADTFCASLAALKGFLDFTRYGSVTVSGAGLREGILFNHAVPYTLEKPINDILGQSIYTLVNYFGESVEHVEHVYNLAMQLFKQLRVLHKLPRQYIRVLRTASLLHDCGMRVKYYGHERHSYYMILNSNLYGITHSDLILSAFTAALHRKSDFNKAEWDKFKSIVTDADYVAVTKMGVLLRIAESLDRSMSGAVTDITCDVLGDSVIMKTNSEVDCSLEIKDALTAAPEFAKAYKKNLEIL